MPSPAVEHPAAPHETAASPAALTAAVEAVLVTLDRPVPAARIAEALATRPALAGTDAAAVELAVDALNADYAASARAFRIERVAGGLRVMTRPEHAATLAAFHRARASAKLSRPALETLAIIAYRQPITRADLESIRGVACGEVLKSLMDRELVRITGRAEELGRPMLYGTTKRFLDTFGLASTKDLPKPDERGELAHSDSHAAAAIEPTPASERIEGN